MGAKLLIIVYYEYNISALILLPMLHMELRQCTSSFAGFPRFPVENEQIEYLGGALSVFQISLQGIKLKI